MAEYDRIDGGGGDFISEPRRTAADDSSSDAGGASNGRTNPLSSAVSVASRLTRKSRAKETSPELAEPLTGGGGDDNDGGGDGFDGDDRRRRWNADDADSGGDAGGGAAADDPFYIFREDLAKKLIAVDDELRRYLNVVRTTDTTANAHEVREIKKGLKRHLKRAESAWADLSTTVRVVEGRREKFPHINDSEIAGRRRFVDDGKGRISAARAEMQSNEARGKLAEDERAWEERRGGDTKKGGGGMDANVAAMDSGGATGSNGWKSIDLEEGGAPRSDSLLMMRRQDDTLDVLDAAVTRVGTMAGSINEEIGHQNKMLGNLEDDLADAEEKLGMVMGKLGKLLKTKSRCQIGMIVILSGVVLVLFFLVVY